MITTINNLIKTVQELTGESEEVIKDKYYLEISDTIVGGHIIDSFINHIAIDGEIIKLKR